MAGSSVKVVGWPPLSMPSSDSRPPAGLIGRVIPECFQPSAAMMIAGSLLSSAAWASVTATSIGNALSRCRPTMIAVARTVSAKTSDPMPIWTLGISACGSDWNPAGTGGFAGLLCTTLSPSMVSVSGWNSPHRPVLPEMLSATPRLV